MADTGTTHVTYYSPDQENVGPFRTLLVFTLMMVTAPIGLYFMSKTVVFEGIFDVDPQTANIYSAIVAVVTIHLVLALAVYVLYGDDLGLRRTVTPSASKKKD
ncbi:vacuolar ATPase assembly integral membrane protein vma21 [Branchiostoma belcheri]|nr:vacuolar ATPase assembly integral membrane protein vma21 [Branchiostoma belcheri]